MSVTVKTFVLYGTDVDISNFDTSKFTDKEEYVDYLYDVINKNDSPYKLIYDEDTDSHCFGYVIDESIDSNWESKYLKSATFSEMRSHITDNVREALDWILMLQFDKRSKNCYIDYRILTVYC
jgi:hypothetical protein